MDIIFGTVTEENTQIKKSIDKKISTQPEQSNVIIFEQIFMEYPNLYNLLSQKDKSTIVIILNHIHNYLVLFISDNSQDYKFKNTIKIVLISSHQLKKNQPILIKI